MANVDKNAVKERLFKDVDWLTNVRPYRNFRNINSLNKVAEYIYSTFREAGAKTAFQEYKVDGHTYRNVIATFGPQNGERIIVGAHYDVHYETPGADDNASGVAGLLELARLLANKNENQLSHRIDLVAYTLEEQPYFCTEEMGSYVHSRALHQQNANVKAMICLEMIGYFSEAPNSQKVPHDTLKNLYPDTADFIVLVGQSGQNELLNSAKKLMEEGADIKVEAISFPAGIPLARRSDHKNYWDFGFNAIMINNTSFLRNPNYHRNSDRIETLDFGRMTEVVLGAYNIILGL